MYDVYRLTKYLLNHKTDKELSSQPLSHRSSHSFDLFDPFHPFDLPPPPPPPSTNRLNDFRGPHFALIRPILFPLTKWVARMNTKWVARMGRMAPLLPTRSTRPTHSARAPHPFRFLYTTSTNRENGACISHPFDPFERPTLSRGNRMGRMGGGAVGQAAFCGLSTLGLFWTRQAGKADESHASVLRRRTKWRSKGHAKGLLAWPIHFAFGG